MNLNGLFEDIVLPNKRALNEERDRFPHPAPKTSVFSRQETKQNKQTVCLFFLSLSQSNDHLLN